MDAQQHPQEQAETTVFTTRRLRVRRAEPQDVEHFHSLWTTPAVMRFVGFPRGLSVTHPQIAARLAAEGDSPLDALLVVERRADGAALGECKLGRPNAAGLATTDVKLLPRFWGRGYGREIKVGLLDYLFTRTDCQVVEATPNVANAASIRMQEAVGGVCVGEDTATPPPHLALETTPVHYRIYQVRRAAWRAARPPDSGLEQQK